MWQWVAFFGHGGRCDIGSKFYMSVKPYVYDSLIDNQALLVINSCNS